MRLILKVSFGALVYPQMLLLLVNAAAAQLLAPAAVTTCSLPATVNCLVGNAQYSVLGTVTASQQSPTTASNYNATMRIDCMYASYSSPVSNVNLVGQSLLVANWGNPKQGCPAGRYAEAELNVQKVYFIYVARAGATPATAVYGINYICVGGIANSTANLQDMSNVLAASPQNSIASLNAGSAQCALPAPAASATPGPSTDQGATTGNDALRSSFIGGLFVALFALLQ